MTAPLPPPGPGVVPPFAAPPTDRNRAALWIGLGVGALVLVLCCVGGVVGVGLLINSGVNQIRSDARAVVTTYLTALQTHHYDDAYDQLCPTLTRSQSLAQFTAVERDKPQVVSFELSDAQIGNAIVVPAQVRYDDGETVAERYRLEQASGTGVLSVCGSAR